MATWRPPKTSYWVTEPVKVVGGTDFQRIEENTEYLKEKLDPNILFVLPSDNILMSATAERSKEWDRYAVVKRFRVHHEGKYKITFEIRTSNSRGSVQARVSIDTGIALTTSLSWTGTSYTSRNEEVYALPGAVITVELRGGRYPEIIGDAPTTGYIRNVHVRGTVVTRADIPGAAVLQN